MTNIFQISQSSIAIRGSWNQCRGKLKSESKLFLSDFSLEIPFTLKVTSFPFRQNRGYVQRSKKHRKNCECRHPSLKSHNVIVNIIVLNCQKCNQCHKCQVSGHKSLHLDCSLRVFSKCHCH